MTAQTERADARPGRGRRAMPERIAFVPGSHLDLFWLGDYRSCLRRGADVIASYLDRCLEAGDETFVIDTVIFVEYFLNAHPSYEPQVRRLVAEGRLDIGAAYVDRWESLVLGESLIRNIQIGRRWCRDRLGIDNRLAVHPDLPGLNPQTAQIYQQAGIRYYVSARKIFPEGRVWRHRSPDGSSLLMLTWPGHYIFVPLEIDDLPEGADRWGDWELSLTDWRERFPLGIIPVSGSAGDLTAPEDFITRFGRDLRDFVAAYRGRYPEIEFGYATPTQLLEPYVDADPPVMTVQGGIPSVWGVAADEEASFFPRAREAERLLLGAETAAVVARYRGLAGIPDSARHWQGMCGEDAFFCSDDAPRPGRKLEDLWRMHVFTQDHNGGGKDGLLSSFQKRVRLDRLMAYALQIADHALGTGDGDTATITAFNPRLQPWEGPLVVEQDSPVGRCWRVGGQPRVRLCWSP